jgi:hypothetical protein
VIPRAVWLCRLALYVAVLLALEALLPGDTSVVSLVLEHPSLPYESLTDDFVLVLWSCKFNDEGGCRFVDVDLESQTYVLPWLVLVSILRCYAPSTFVIYCHNHGVDMCGWNFDTL